MTNQQLYLAIGIPALATFIALLLNMGAFFFLYGKIDKTAESIRSEMRADRAEVLARLDKLGERLHDDMQSIMGRDREMDKRVMKLEGTTN